MKTIASWLAVFLLLTAAFPAAGQTVRPNAVIPHEVLAFYYPWYGSPEKRGHPIHWGKIDSNKRTITNTAHYPTNGAYDSMDPALLDAQLDLAQIAAITGFIASWWGQGKYEDKAIPILLERAAKKKFKISIYWEKAPGHGAAQIDQAVSDLVYLLTRYGKNEAFLKADGFPCHFCL
jgi:glycoprotein endo-alpha-1,2-mannosidase